MDDHRVERWDNERGDPASRRRSGILAQRARQQSHHPVLGGRGGHNNDYIDHQHYDDAPYVNDLIDIYDHQHILHNNNVNNGPIHHHHGPNDNDILIHNHDGPDDHNHNVAYWIDGAVFHHKYGAADHYHSNRVRGREQESDTVSERLLVNMHTRNHDDLYGPADHKHDAADPAEDGATKRSVLRCLGCDEPVASGSRYCDACWGGTKGVTA